MHNHLHRSKALENRYRGFLSEHDRLLNLTRENPRQRRQNGFSLCFWTSKKEKKIDVFQVFETNYEKFSMERGAIDPKITRQAMLFRVNYYGLGKPRSFYTF